MKLCLDTNVLVSALTNSSGASRQILRSLAHGEIQAAASVAMFLEYEDVLKRPKILKQIKLSSLEIDEFLDGLAGLVDPVQPFFLWRPSLKDPADEHVLEAAVNGNVDILVTFNLKDFQPHISHFGIDALTPRDALKEITDKLRS